MKQALLIVGLLVAGCSLASARVWVVAPNGDDAAAGTVTAPLATIQKAVDATVAGDTIRVLGGVYKQRFVVADRQYTRSKPLRILGLDGAIMDGSVGGSSITLKNCRNVMLIGFETRNYATMRNSVSMNNCQECWVQNCIFNTGKACGVRAFSCSNCRFVNNFGTHTDQDAIYMASGSHDNLIEGNLCAFNDGSEENADGIAASDSEKNTYRYNILYRNSDDGLDMWTSMRNTVEYNWSARNGVGANGDGNGFKLGGRWGDEANPVWIGGQHVVRWNVSTNNTHTGFSNNGSTGNVYESNFAWGNGTGYDEVGINGDRAQGEKLLARIRAYWQRQIDLGKIDWKRAMAELPTEFSQPLTELGVKLPGAR